MVAGSALRLAQAVGDSLPAEPPIGGPIWTTVVPALLLAVAVVATVLLYRHFAKEEVREPKGG